MKAGDRIRVFGIDYTVEEFRYCLGVFASERHREAGVFIPLCDLYEAGAESETKYISNFGEYTSNQVQAWMDIVTSSENRGESDENETSKIV